MWRYESIAVLTPGITAGVGTYLDPAVYLNQLEEQNNDTEVVAVFPTLNRILVRHRPREIRNHASPSTDANEVRRHTDQDRVDDSQER